MTRAIDQFRQTLVTLPAGVILDAHNEFVRLIAEKDHAVMRGEDRGPGWRPYWVRLRTELGAAVIAEPEPDRVLSRLLCTDCGRRFALWADEEKWGTIGSGGMSRTEVDQMFPDCAPHLIRVDAEQQPVTDPVDAELTELLEQVTGLFNRVRGVDVDLQRNSAATLQPDRRVIQDPEWADVVHLTTLRSGRRVLIYVGEDSENGQVRVMVGERIPE